MYKLSRQECELAKNIKWDKIYDNVFRFYDSNNITVDLFKRFNDALVANEIDVIKPVALLVQASSAMGRNKYKSPYFSCISAINSIGDVYYLDTQYLINQLITHGLMSKHAAFPAEYTGLTDFYIANNNRDFIFNIDGISNRRTFDLQDESVDLWYVVGAKQSYINDAAGKRGIANFDAIDTVIKNFKLGVEMKKNFEVVGNTPQKRVNSYDLLAENLATMVAIPIPESCYMPNIELYFNDNEVIVKSEYPMNVHLFMYEYFLNSDVFVPEEGYTYRVDTGRNADAGNNIFNKELWKHDDTDDIKRLKDEKAEKEKEKEELRKSHEPVAIQTTDVNTDDEAIRMMTGIASGKEVEPIVENTEDVFDAIINDIE